MREMKDSGVEWLGKIPSCWNLIKTKYLLSKHKDIAGSDSSNYQRLALTMNGVVRRSKYADDGLQPASFDQYQIIHHGDFVFKLIDLQNISTSRVGLSPYEGLVSPAYIVASPTGRIESKYLEYFYIMMWRNEVFNALGAGVRQSLGYQEFGNVSVLFPSQEEQLRIVNYLDTKCSEIDRAIEAAEKSIEEFKAYKNSSIFQAVTKGLEEHIDRKDSGVEWLGEIPTHWAVTPIKHLFYISKIIAGKTGFDVLSITQKGLKVKDITSGEGQIAADYSDYQVVEPGDYAMNHMDLLTGWVDISSQIGVTSPDYRVFKARSEDMNKHYFLRVFQYYYFGRVFYGFCKGISSKGRWRLPANAFGNIQIPVPPLDEQCQIANYLDEQCAQIDRIVESKQAIIEDLKAYKESLIYEVVTGKREV